MAARDSFIVKKEVFDHAVYPCPPRLNPTTLQTLVKSLHLACSLDGRISHPQWADAAIKSLGLSLSEAETYYETCKAAFIGTTSTSLDLKPLSLFLALQLFSSASGRLSLENAVSLSSRFNVEHPFAMAGPSMSGTYPSPAMSPRSKPVRGLIPQTSDYNLAVQFLKSNLTLILKLLSAEYHSKNPTLSCSDLSPLSLLFYSVPADFGRSLPHFAGKAQAFRVPANDISEWLCSRIQPDNLESSSRAFLFTGLSRCVTVKQGSEVTNRDIRIVGCEDSYFYINAHAKSVFFSNCKDVTVFVAAVAKVTSMDKCEGCTLVLATHCLKVGNSVDCTINVYSALSPVLFGDNRSLALGPFNLFYSEVLHFVERAGINTSNPQNVLNYSGPVLLNSEPGSSYCHLIQPKDFFPFIMPKEFPCEELSPILTPEEHRQAPRIREEYFASIQARISAAGLSSDQERQLHQAIQGYFREWLVSTGHIKGPTELVKMIDQE
jgi:TBCC domain-containing protein 1